MNPNTGISGSSYGGGVQKSPVRENITIKKPPLENVIHSPKALKQAHLEGASIPISEEQLIGAIDRAIKAMEGTTTSLQFSIHEKTKHIMVKVLDKQTGEVIREIPQEKSLDFLAKVWEMAGLIVDERR